MARATHPDVNEGYTAMKKALRKNPRMLYTLLNSRRADLETAFHSAVDREDANSASEIAASIEKVDEALERLEAKFLFAQEGEQEGPAVMGEDRESKEEAPAQKSAPIPKSIGLGFRRPEPEELADEERAENPVAMNSRLRREMGNGAANWLDDYALAIYQKAIQFFSDLKTKALVLQDSMELGEDDPNDGETSLREMLLIEVGRRGVADIEPLFEDWRSGVVRQIVKDVKDMFDPPATAVELKDEQIGSLLGLDALDEELAEQESEGTDNAEAEPEEDEEPSSEAEEPAEDEDGEDGEEPADDEEEAEEAVEAAAQPIIKVARGPVSVTLGTKKPVSASVKAPSPQKAHDFVPSGYSTPRLE